MVILLIVLRYLVSNPWIQHFLPSDVSFLRLSARKVHHCVHFSLEFVEWRPEAVARYPD